MSFRLRRIGDSLQGDVTLFNLLASVISIGRHSESNLCLISKEHPCLTSRLHAEIHCISDGESEEKYLLRDASLNGTYVNDRRVIDYHLLDEGDIITFGHYGGHLIKKGELAPKKQAEFQFIFEKVIRDVLVPESRYLSSQMSSISQRSFDKSDDEFGKVLKTSIHGVKEFTQSDSETSSLDFNYERCLAGDAGLDALFSSSSRVRDVAVPMNTQSSSYHEVSMPVRKLPDDTWHRLDRLQSDCNSSTTAKMPFPILTQQRVSASVAPIPIVNSSRLTESNKRTVRNELNSRNPLFESGNHQNNKLIRRHSEQDCAAVVRKTSGKKAAKGTSNSRNRKSDDLIYHSSKDKCAALECLMPKSSKVLWVQCDDCDAWYHATCAGCTSSASQLAVSQFHCGCN